MLINQMIPVSTLDLLQADGDLFAELRVPEGLNRQRVIDTILLRYGDTPLYRADPNFMHYYIGSWSDTHADIWQKLYNTTRLEYNPIYNFDRTEESTDSHTSNRKLDESGSSESSNSTETNTENSNTGTTTDTAEHKVSADNSDEYEPGTQDNTRGTQTGSGSASSESSGRDNTDTEHNLSESLSDSTTHKARLYGNIGVTTTQQMIASERECVQYNIYEAIADSYKDTFCLLIY